MKMSLAEFDRRAHTEWKGRKWYYDTAYQGRDGQLSFAQIHVGFTEVAVVTHPNCVTFMTASGDKMSLSGITGIESFRVLGATEEIVFSVGGRNGQKVSVIMR